jgi:hypothetical protein
MSELIAIAYPDVSRAEQVLANLGRTRRERLFDLDRADESAQALEAADGWPDQARLAPPAPAVPLGGLTSTTGRSRELGRPFLTKSAEDPPVGHHG